MALLNVEAPEYMIDTKRQHNSHKINHNNVLQNQFNSSPFTHWWKRLLWSMDNCSNIPSTICQRYSSRLQHKL